MEKSVIVLTNFWDANSLIDQGYFIYPVKENEAYKINIYSDVSDVRTDGTHKGNHSVYSIALSHPSLTDLSNLSSMIRLDVFCPTYDMLKRYKENSDWEAYTKDYWGLLKSRKNRITSWAKSLVGGRVYFLCCWENTSGKAHCHREILYQAMKGSKLLGEKSLVIYRKGNEIKRRRERGPDDLDFVRSQLAQTSNDPNLTIVTHHAFPMPLYVSNQLSNPRFNHVSRRDRSRSSTTSALPPPDNF